MKLMQEFHDSLWAGHRGVWATFSKLKEKYSLKGMYKDVSQFVESCVTCLCNLSNVLKCTTS